MLKLHLKRRRQDQLIVSFIKELVIELNTSYLIRNLLYLSKIYRQIFEELANFK
jgi:hypothetical protein